MKIAIIGNGIIGSVSAIYLSNKGYSVDLIGPDFNNLETILKKSLNSYFRSNGEINGNYITPKFSRKDFIKHKLIGDKYFKKKNQNFFSLEIPAEMGLAKFWGANLAIKGLSPYINDLNLTLDEKKFIDNLIPMLDVHSYYKKIYSQKRNNFYDNYLFNNESKNQYELQSSTLSLWEEKFDKDNLPGFESSPSIFGSYPINLKKCKRIDGLVKKIELSSVNDKSQTLIHIDNNNKKYQKTYDYVFLASGAIGSYRILMSSLEQKKNKNNFNRIKHHPMISSLTFIPHIPYPHNHIGMSNLDLKLKIDNAEIFINFHPLESFLKYKFLSIKNYKKNRVLQFLYKIFKQIPEIPFSPTWFLRRVYIAAIYFPSKFSSSYICYKNNEIKIQGGYISDFENDINKKIWKNICINLRVKKVYNLLRKPIKIDLGADFHYASSLSKYTDNDGFIKFNNQKTKVIVLDASSSKDLPTPNPTYFFILRAIRLLRFM